VRTTLVADALDERDALSVRSYGREPEESSKRAPEVLIVELDQAIEIHGDVLLRDAGSAPVKAQLHTAHKQSPGDVAIGGLERELKRGRRWFFEVPIEVAPVRVDAWIELPNEQPWTVGGGRSEHDAELADVDLRHALLNLGQPEDLTPTRAPVFINLLPAVLERA
jgi:hypothetical protein